MKTLSFVVRSWHDPQFGATRVQVVNADSVEEVRLTETSFLVRATVDEQQRVHRCLIRHLGSGHEAYLQGGRGLSAFIKACLLDSTRSSASAAESNDSAS